MLQLDILKSTSHPKLNQWLKQKYIFRRTSFIYQICIDSGNNIILNNTSNLLFYFNVYNVHNNITVLVG